MTPPQSGKQRRQVARRVYKSHNRRRRRIGPVNEQVWKTRYGPETVPCVREDRHPAAYVRVLANTARGILKCGPQSQRCGLMLKFGQRLRNLSPRTAREAGRLSQATSRFALMM